MFRPHDDVSLLPLIWEVAWSEHGVNDVAFLAKHLKILVEILSHLGAFPTLHLLILVPEIVPVDVLKRFVSVITGLNQTSNF